MPRTVRHRTRDGEAPNFKFDWFDVVVVVTTATQQIVQTVANGLDIVDDLCRAHANYRRERIEWADNTIKEIESL